MSDPFVYAATGEDEKNWTIHLRVPFSRTGYLQGKLNGLGDEDAARFKSGEYRGELITQFLATGDGLGCAENIVFVPEVITVRDVMEDGLEERCTICGRIPYFPLEDDAVSNHAFGKEFVSSPLSDYERNRLNIINAFGCDESQNKLLRENKRLRALKCRADAIRDKMANVEILHSEGKFVVPVTEGRLTVGEDGSPCWSIVLFGRERSDRTELFMLPANDMLSLKVNLCGTCHFVFMTGIGPGANDGGIREFRVEFLQGPIIYGQFDNKMNLSEEELEEFCQGFLVGVRTFPDSYSLILTQVDFPYWSACDSLEILRSISDDMVLAPFHINPEQDSHS